MIIAGATAATHRSAPVTRSSAQVRDLLDTFEARFAEAVAEEERAMAEETEAEVRRKKQEEDDEVLRRMRETMGAPTL